MIDETLECDLYNQSNCCNAPFYGESDVCTACMEHADIACNDCELFNECNNANKPLRQM